MLEVGDVVRCIEEYTLTRGEVAVLGDIGVVVKDGDGEWSHVWVRWYAHPEVAEDMFERDYLERVTDAQEETN